MDPVAPPIFRVPGLVERRRKRWTLPLCIFTISLIEFIFYCFVIALFSIGLTFFKEFPKLHQDEQVREILRFVIIGFAGIYVLLSLILFAGVFKKVRALLVIWMIGVVICIILEWICVVVSVALFLNGALFFISGSYGPVRLCFVCLTGLYAQRLGKQNTTVVPLVKANDQTDGDGYSLVHNAIFTQNMEEDEERESVKVTFELTGDDQSLI